MKLRMTIDVELEDGRMEDDEELFSSAESLLADQVRQLGEHTVAQEVEGKIHLLKDGKPYAHLASADYKGNLRSEQHLKGTAVPLGGR